MKKSTLHYNVAFSPDYLRPAYWGTWLAVVVLFVVFLMPAFIQDFIANRLGDLGRNLNSKRRRIARKNIELCFSDTTEAEKKQLLRANFRHQARSVLHYGLIWWAPKWLLKRRIRIEGEANLQQPLQQGQSVIVMAAHSLGLETAVAITAINHQVTGPFNPMKNRLVDWFVARGRTRQGTLIYTRKAGLRPVIKDVRKGAVMFYLPDEDLGRERSIFADFFGVQKATVPVLGRLAKSCQAKVIPCVACYDEVSRQYVVHYFPAIEEFPAGDDTQDTAVMNQALEKLVRICPEQYFWTMKLFRTRPEGEKSLYD